MLIHISLSSRFKILKVNDKHYRIILANHRKNEQDVVDITKSKYGYWGVCGGTVIKNGVMKGGTSSFTDLADAKAYAVQYAAWYLNFERSKRMPRDLQTIDEHVRKNDAVEQDDDGFAYASSKADMWLSQSKMHKGNTDPKNYLVVEDVNKHSTWHLPVYENGVPHRRLMGDAWAALTKNFRGNAYQGPRKKYALRELTKLYHSLGLKTPDEK